MKLVRILFLAFALLAFNMQYAQEAAKEEQLSLDKGSIKSQFEFLAKKSGNYRALGIRYEVVKVSNLNKIRQNVLDTINVINAKTTELNTTILAHEDTITSLNDKLKETTTSLSTVTEEKDSMSFLGMSVSKVSYNFILWTIIACLLLISFLLGYKFRNSNVLTQDAKTNLSELEIEYEDHRRRSLEREQKINRKLQDELNKSRK
ncbi:MAG: tRNA (guanine-N1)-methyltransferase [Cellulophaga sp.]